MPSVTDCFYQCLRHVRTVAPIATVLRPLLYEIPVVTKNRVIPCALESRNFQIRNSYQVFQIVCVAGLASVSLTRDSICNSLRFTTPIGIHLDRHPQITRSKDLRR
jgi:hypothetical protein